MFADVCSRIRKAVYCLVASTSFSDDRTAFCSGTAFMVRPGLLVTTSHLVHRESRFDRPVHATFAAVCATDLGSAWETCQLIGDDPNLDAALVRVDAPRNHVCANLSSQVAAVGSACGSLAFPFSGVLLAQDSPDIPLIERFQKANISAYYPAKTSGSRTFASYETDSVMYQGSSGCPGFLDDGTVFGMHSASVVAGAGSGHGTKERLAISRWIPSVDLLDLLRRL